MLQHARPAPAPAAGRTRGRSRSAASRSPRPRPPALATGSETARRRARAPATGRSGGARPRTAACARRSARTARPLPPADRAGRRARCARRRSRHGSPGAGWPQRGSGSPRACPLPRAAGSRCPGRAAPRRCTPAAPRQGRARASPSSAIVADQLSVALGANRARARHDRVHGGAQAVQQLFVGAPAQRPRAPAEGCAAVGRWRSC